MVPTWGYGGRMASHALYAGAHVIDFEYKSVGVVSALENERFALVPFVGDVAWYPLDIVYMANGDYAQLICATRNLDRYRLDPTE
jgi:hypothetical protein